MKPDQKEKLAFRAVELRMERAEGEAGPGKVRMSVSSELPVLTLARFNDQWQRVYEILDHAPTSIDMSRCKDGLVILDNHGGDQVGLMTVDIKDRKIGGLVEFCTGARAQEIAADAAKGLRKNASVGYAVNPESYRLEGTQDGIPLVRAMSWMPYEASFVSVPADPSVGVGRAVTEIEKPKEKTMDAKEMSALFARAAQFGIEAAKVEELVAAGKGRAELDAMIVERQAVEVKELRAAKVAPPPAAPVIPVLGGAPGEQAKIVRKYSLMNVARALTGDRVDIGFEREVSQECAKLSGRDSGKLIIPHAVLGKRDLTVLGTSSASVGTNLDAGSFIELLRSNTILAPLGVRFMTGLRGDLAIPKMTAGATNYWVAEGSDITESTPTLGQVTGTPHTCGVLVDISRKLLIQSTPDAEMLVRDEFVQRLARGVQIAVFQGTGADGQPLAITGATGINNPSVTQGTPTFAELLNFPGSIMADNAMADNMKWAMTGEVWAKLAATATNGAGSLLALDYASKSLIGFPYFVSEDVGANSLFFGNWAAVMVGIWGMGVEINADTATLSASGGLRLVGLQDVDVMVRNGQALAYNSAVTA